jgi:glucose dehydrogenase
MTHDEHADAIEELRDRISAINSYNILLQTLTALDRDTGEIDWRIEKRIDDELTEVRRAIDRVERATRRQDADASEIDETDEDIDTGGQELERHTGDRYESPSTQ